MVGRGVFLIAALLVADLRRRLAAGLRLAGPAAGRRASACCSSAPTPPPSRWRGSSSSAARELGVGIVGFVDPDPDASRGADDQSRRHRHGRRHPVDRARAHDVDRVVVSLVDARGKLPMDKLLEMQLDRGVSFDHLASVYEEYTGKIAVENLRPSWLIFSEGFQQDARSCSAVKRRDRHRAGRDRPGAAVAGHADRGRAGVKLTSPGPVLLPSAPRRASTERCSPCTSCDRCAPTPKRRPAPCGRRRAIARVTRVGAVPAADAARRDPAALERAGRRDEPGRAAARAAGVRRGADREDSVLRPAPRRQARPDRLGAGALHVRRERRGRAREAAVRPVLHQARHASRSICSSCSRPSRPSSCGEGGR